MINSMTRDWFGAPCRARSAHTVFGILAEFGGGCDIGSARQRATLLVRADVPPTFTAAPQAYLNDVVPPSAALHERSP